MKRLIDCLEATIEINQILNLDFNNLVKFSTLRTQVKKGDTLMIEDSSNVCVYNEFDRIKFKTTIPPKGLFGVHYHDCKEKCIILEGTYQDNKNGMVYGVGDVVQYDKYEVHQPFNPSETEETVLEVIFSILN